MRRPGEIQNEMDINGYTEDQQQYKDIQIYIASISKEEKKDKQRDKTT